MNWNEQLTTLRRRAGLTQRAVAERIGAHPTSLIRWEAGAAVPRADDLADWLHVVAATDAEIVEVLRAIRLHRLGRLERTVEDLRRICRD